MQVASSGGCKNADIGIIAYLHFFASSTYLHLSALPGDDTTLQEWTSLNPPSLKNDIDAGRSKYLGKTFKAPGKHRAMPKVTIKHIENTCQVSTHPHLAMHV